MNKKQQRTAKLNRQQELVSTAKAENRALTAEEQAEFDTLQREIDQLGTEIEAEERQMGNATPPPSPSPTSNATDTVSDQQRAIIEGERRRISEITAMCRDFDVDPKEYIDGGSSVDQVRAAVLEHLRSTRGPLATGVHITESGEDEFRRDAADSLLLRSGLNAAVENPANGARQLSQMSLRDLAIECLSRENRPVSALLRMSSDDLYAELARQFYNPSAAFPAILDETIRKSIAHLYNNVPTTFQAFTTRGSLKDFKATPDHEYVIGGVGDFLLVPENGEIKASTPRTGMLPQRKLDTYGKQFSMTRQAFINDDIGFLAAMPAQFASRAKRTINRQVYELIFQNPAVFDGIPLFEAAHRNLISEGSAPSIAVMEKMIEMMGMQVDQFGESIMVEPASVIVPMGWGMRVSQLLGTAEIDVDGIGSHTVNVLNTEYRSKIKIVQEGVLNVLAGENACPWFMAADPRLAKGVQVDYLNGVTTPTFRRSEKAGYLGFVWDIWLDWVVSAMDFRGVLRNNGVKLNG